MSANTNPIYPLTMQNSFATFQNADGTNKKDVLTAGPNGTRIDTLHLTSDEPVTDRYVDFYINNGTTDYFRGRVKVAALSGLVTMPWVEGLNGVNAGNALFLKAGYKLRAAMSAAVTATQTVTLSVDSGDY